MQPAVGERGLVGLRPVPVARRDVGVPRLTALMKVMPRVIMAPFGFPVVPDVYMMVEISSRLTDSCAARRGEVASAFS
jgi:hypothetical protein